MQMVLDNIHVTLVKGQKMYFLVNASPYLLDVVTPTLHRCIGHTM